MNTTAFYAYFYIVRNHRKRFKMAYKSMEDCVSDLEQHGHLVRISEEVDPNLEMAAIHRRVYEANGPAILFENIKGSPFRAVSNLFGNLERSRFMFRNDIDQVKKLVNIKLDPSVALKKPLSHLNLFGTAVNSLPKKVSSGPVMYKETTIDKLPLVKCWPKDGGAFVTLPIVYSEDVDEPGVMKSNLGMYRIQLSGNDYEMNKEIGLHYQLHRGIGVHQTKANGRGEDFKVSVFVGGPPSHTFAAVMPLPEGVPEVSFAGALGGRRFRYTTRDGHTISAEADFVITGTVSPDAVKPEGPFGDHLGYYSLTHDFPLMKVHKVYHRENAIWPFTVVGRPPQEDTSFGALIHDIVGGVISKTIPGVKEVHAVDASGVHPLLLAIGSERYTPYIKERTPAEILTLANNILGFGQMSLAKYLIIAAKEDHPNLDTHDIPVFLSHILERIDWSRDLHFHTKTSIDTLDYSGESLNSGSKVVFAAAGELKRTLGKESPTLQLPAGFENTTVVLDGIIAIKASAFTTYDEAKKEMQLLTAALQDQQDQLKSFPLILVCDDSTFVSATLNNFLWVTFTRSNPSHDIYGVESFTENKHWGCKGSLLIDVRIKPHHAPPLIEDENVEAHVDRLAASGASLHGIIEARK